MNHWKHLGKYQGLPDTEGMSDALLDETIEAFWRTPLRQIALDVIPAGYELHFDGVDDIYLRPVGSAEYGPYWLKSNSDDTPTDWLAGGPTGPGQPFGNVATGLRHIAQLAREKEGQA